MNWVRRIARIDVNLRGAEGTLAKAVALNRPWTSAENLDEVVVVSSFSRRGPIERAVRHQDVRGHATDAVGIDQIVEACPKNAETGAAGEDADTGLLPAIRELAVLDRDVRDRGVQADGSSEGFVAPIEANGRGDDVRGAFRDREQRRLTSGRRNRQVLDRDVSRTQDVEPADARRPGAHDVDGFVERPADHLEGRIRAVRQANHCAGRRDVQGGLEGGWGVRRYDRRRVGRGEKGRCGQNEHGDQSQTAQRWLQTTHGRRIRTIR